MGVVEWVRIFVDSLFRYRPGSIDNKSGKIFLAFLLTVSSAFYFVMIFFFPYFHTDDYYIFSLISSTPGDPVSLNPYEIFYLFFRPISYFSFWADYHIFGTNPFFIKLVSVSLHLVLIVILFKFLTAVLEYFKLPENFLLITILLFLFSFHPDVVLYIININNRSELLMLLFYAASLLVFIYYMQGKIKTGLFIPAVLVLYIMSVLSKQSGLHLPLLFLIIIFILKTEAVKKKAVIFESAGMLVIAFIFSYLNFTFIQVNLFDAETLWRKPLSMGGTILFVVIPMIAESLYRFALSHKTAAVLLTLILAVTSFILLDARNKKKLAAAFLFLCILFFPRVFALGGGRINTHILLWIIVLLLFVLTRYRYELLYTALTGYIMFILAHSVCVVKDSISYYEARKEQSFKLKQIAEKVYPKKIFVVLSEMASFLDEYNYFITGRFSGHDIPAQALVSKKIFPGIHRWEKSISYKKEKNEILFTSDNPDVFIGDHPVNRLTRIYNTWPVGKKDREYRKYKVRLHDSIFAEYIVTFFNGQNWELVK